MIPPNQFTSAAILDQAIAGVFGCYMTTNRAQPKKNHVIADDV